jgi:methylenetetrahydrofolate dehydrogenase (NADP+) / methenyltetrahydrofolate cyclohydrolase
LAAQLLDGKATAAKIRSELAEQVVQLKQKGIVPGLGTILVGDDPGSHSYVAGKHRDCEQIGVKSFRVDLPASASLSDIKTAIRDFNQAADVTGYIIQLPLPVGIDTNAILEMIDPAKDADGLHPVNLGKLVLAGAEQLTSPLPCTPAGIVELLQRYGISLKGSEVVVIGRGITVGRPLGLLLSKKGIDATVTLAHSATKNIAEVVRRADVVVAALGVAHIVKPDWIKPGAAVLDVGITRVENENGAVLLGDVDPAVSDIAGYLSPNPGGVGPMTRAMLLRNVVTAASY